MGWLEGWEQRKSHVINQTVGAGVNYQVCVKVYKGSGVDGTENYQGVVAGKIYCGGKCQNDFGDIRFTESNGTSLLDYWIETKFDGNYAIFWVEVTNDLDSGNATIYIYYKTAGTSYTTSNGLTTFPFFDDFSSDKGWQKTAGVTISGGHMNLASGGPYWADIDRPAGLSQTQFRWKFRGKTNITNNGWRVFVLVVEDFSTNPALRSDYITHYLRDYYYVANLGNQVKIYVVESGSGEVASGTLGPARDSSYHTHEGTRDATAYRIFWDALNNSDTSSKTPSGVKISIYKEYTSLVEVDWLFLAKYITGESTIHGSWGEEEDPPPEVEVSTDNATDMTCSSAVMNGTISGAEVGDVNERGFEWGIESGVYPNKWTEIGSFGSGSYSHEESLDEFTIYYYRAKVKVAESGEWVYGSEKVIRTLCCPAEDCLNPVIDLMWVDNAVNETDYYVERKTVGGPWELIAVLPPNSETYSDSDVEGGVTYLYRIRAGNSNSGLYSNYVTLTEPITCPYPLIGGVVRKPEVQVFRFFIVRVKGDIGAGTVRSHVTDVKGDLGMKFLEKILKTNGDISFGKIDDDFIIIKGDIGIPISEHLFNAKGDIGLGVIKSHLFDVKCKIRTIIQKIKDNLRKKKAVEKISEI